MQFIDELDQEYAGDIITVVIPEFVTSWSTQWLHNSSALALKAKLLHRPHTAVVSVPVHMVGTGIDECGEHHVTGDSGVAIEPGDAAHGRPSRRDRTMRAAAQAAP